MEGGHKDTIVTMAWEPQGKRFVTGGRDGKLFLWEMALEGDEILGELVGEVPIKKGDCVGIPPITSIVWTQKSVIYVADASGIVYLVSPKDEDLKRDKKNLANRATGDVDESNKLATQPDEIEKAPQKESGLRRLQKKTVQELSDDDDDDMFDEDAKEWTNEDETTRAGKKTDASKFIEDEAEDAADEDETSVDIHASHVARNPPSRVKDDTLYDDMDTNLMPQDNADPEEDIFQTHQEHIDRDQDYANHHTTSLFPPLQPAFAPSSTPIHEPRRILCWNHIGVVTTYPDPDSQYNLVDVAFHETAGLVGGRRPINFTDNLGFIVGTLGEEGALFASDLMEEEDDDDLDDDEFHDLGVMSEAARKAVKLSRRKKKREDSGKGSHVYFNRFETFGRNADKDWVVALPDGERVMGCATGRGWCGVITRFVETENHVTLIDVFISLTVFFSSQNDQPSILTSFHNGWNPRSSDMATGRTRHGHWPR
jgi:chromosome transmission fidelity protein 4